MQQDITKNEEEAIKGYHIWDSMFPNTFEYVRDAVERVVKSYPNTLVLHTEQLSKITELDMGSPRLCKVFRKIRKKLSYECSTE